MNSDKNNVLLALVTGTAIGGILGILYAPDSGLKTRQNIKSKTLETTHEITEKLQHAKEDLATVAQKKKVEFEEKLNTVITKASLKVDDLIVDLEQKLEELKKQNARLQKSS